MFCCLHIYSIHHFLLSSRIIIKNKTTVKPKDFFPLFPRRPYSPLESVHPQPQLGGGLDPVSRRTDLLYNSLSLCSTQHNTNAATRTYASIHVILGAEFRYELDITRSNRFEPVQALNKRIFYVCNN